MKQYLIIKADTNDADFVMSKNLISKEELDEIMPVIRAIKEYNEDTSIKRQKYNWWQIDYGSDDREPNPQKLYVDTGKCTEEALVLFSEYVPYFESGVHTIESIQLLKVVEETNLL